MQPVRDCFFNVDISHKSSSSKDGPVQVGPIIGLLDAIPENALSSKQGLPQPSKHNLHTCHDLGLESMVCADTWSTSIGIAVNRPKMACPSSGDRPRDRKIGFRGPTVPRSLDNSSHDTTSMGSAGECRRARRLHTSAPFAQKQCIDRQISWVL